jgi:hypothetical protein
MYTLVRQLGSREIVAREAPTCAASLVLAEFLYKFHSFTLECLAFMATWLALSALTSTAVGLLKGRESLAKS